MEAKYLWADVREMVMVFICSSERLLIAIGMSFILGIVKSPFSKSTLLVLLGHWKDCLPDFFLNFGKPAPMKKFLKATSNFLIEACNAWLSASFNQGATCFA
jgi:hypothetical protein